MNYPNLMNGREPEICKALPIPGLWQPRGKRYYSIRHYPTEIESLKIFEPPKDDVNQQNQDFQIYHDFPRNLTTKDIEGAVVGTNKA